MKTYQAKYKDRHGKTKSCNEWYLTLNDRTGTRRRLKAYSNKDESTKLGHAVETLMANNGKLRTDADKRWFCDLMPRIQNKLIEWNVVDRQNTVDHLATPLLDHLQVFLESRRAKACKEYYISQTESSIQKVLNGCRFRMHTDIDALTVETFLAKGRGDDGYSEGTYNGHLQAFKTFAKWLSDERQLTPDPMARTKLVKQTEFRKKRRALTADEKDRLLIATRNGKRRGKMSAEARYLVYRIATECGLRYSEIRALRVLSFDFDANPCTIRVEAENAKGKESDNLILNDETAAEIKTFLADKESTDLAFNLPHNSHAAEMIRGDLAKAGVEYTDASGRDCDFHSCRHYFITSLFLAGVPATVVQRLARHKDLKTTMLYSHVTLADQVSAIRKLRVLTVSCPNSTQQKTTVDNRGLRNSDNIPLTALSA